MSALDTEQSPPHRFTVPRSPRLPSAALRIGQLAAPLQRSANIASSADFCSLHS